MSRLREIFITGAGALTPAGETLGVAAEALFKGVPALGVDDAFGPVGRLHPRAQERLERLGEDREFRHHDRAVLAGILAARDAWKMSGTESGQGCGVVFGSSRGATSLLETQHAGFLESGRLAVHTSPMTTAGIFASSVARDLGLPGLALSVSSACTTSMNALVTGAALLRSGMLDTLVAGGSEAALTPFTMTMLDVTRVTGKTGGRHPSLLFPVKPFHPERVGLVAAEGAAAVTLTSKAARSPMARILGVGAASERASPTGISPEGAVLRAAIDAALADAGLAAGDINLLVAHGSGTPKGDAAEWNAYQAMFGAHMPAFTCHKWLTGHMIGASSAFSVACAVQHMIENRAPAMPYWERGMPGSDEHIEGRFDRVLVTSLGFGGSASCVILGRP